MNSSTLDISIYSIIATISLTIIPIMIIYYYNKKIVKKAIIAISRMIIQLFLAAIYLRFLFKYNNPFINISWYIIMIVAASHSVLNNTTVKFKKLILPITLSIFTVNFILIIFFNEIIVKSAFLFNTKYFIVVSGMLLGNSLKAIVIGVEEFYLSIRDNNSTQLFLLGNGANFKQSVQPFIKDAITKSSSPIIASMTAVGIVHLPGMMVGQLLGGVSPAIAIKYQIVIMLVIFTSIVMSVFFSLTFSLKTAFNKCGILDYSIYKD